MTAYNAATLEAWATEVLIAVGLSSDDAAAVASSLAFAEARGTGSHGYVRLPIYADRVLAGGVNARHSRTTIDDRGALVSIDADGAPGASTARASVRLAVERAQQYGVGWVTVSNANHFGAAAQYSSLIANAGMIGIVACNTDRAMSAPGGGRAVLGTNPLSIAIPTDAGRRPVLDMATTEVAYGKLLLAAQAGTDIPLGWAVDERGLPTTDPAAGLRGALLPAGGPKGFGLAFMIDALLAAGGAHTSPRVSPLHGDAAQSQRLGQLFVAVSLSLPQADFTEAIDDQIAELVASRDEDAPRVLFPGEPEANREASSGGLVELDEPTIASLRKLGLACGVVLE